MESRISASRSFSVKSRPGSMYSSSLDEPSGAADSAAGKNTESVLRILQQLGETVSVHNSALQEVHQGFKQVQTAHAVPSTVEGDETVRRLQTLLHQTEQELVAARAATAEANAQLTANRATQRTLLERMERIEKAAKLDLEDGSADTAELKSTTAGLKGIASSADLSIQLDMMTQKLERVGEQANGLVMQLVQDGNALAESNAYVPPAASQPSPAPAEPEEAGAKPPLAGLARKRGVSNAKGMFQKLSVAVKKGDFKGKKGRASRAVSDSPLGPADDSEDEKPNLAKMARERAAASKAKAVRSTMAAPRFRPLEAPGGLGDIHEEASEAAPAPSEEPSPWPRFGEAGPAAVAPVSPAPPPPPPGPHRDALVDKCEDLVNQFQQVKADVTAQVKDVAEMFDSATTTILNQLQGGQRAGGGALRADSFKGSPPPREDAAPALGERLEELRCQLQDQFASKAEIRTAVETIYTRSKGKEEWMMNSVGNLRADMLAHVDAMARKQWETMQEFVDERLVTLPSQANQSDQIMGEMRAEISDMHAAEMAELKAFLAGEVMAPLRDQIRVCEQHIEALHQSGMALARMEPKDVKMLGQAVGRDVQSRDGSAAIGGPGAHLPSSTPGSRHPLLYRDGPIPEVHELGVMKDEIAHLWTIVDGMGKYLRRAHADGPHRAGGAEDGAYVSSLAKDLKLGSKGKPPERCLSCQQTVSPSPDGAVHKRPELYNDSLPAIERVKTFGPSIPQLMQRQDIERRYMAKAARPITSHIPHQPQIKYERRFESSPPQAFYTSEHGGLGVTASLPDIGTPELAAEDSQSGFIAVPNTGGKKASTKATLISIKQPRRGAKPFMHSGKIMEPIDGWSEATNTPSAFI